MLYVLQKNSQATFTHKYIFKEWIDVVTGWDSAPGIVKNRRYSGRLVGRYANRIANGEFTLDGTTYTLFKNNGGPDSNLHSLHGGEFGFDRKLWEMKGKRFI